VPGIKTAAELARLGRHFNGRHLMTAAFEGRDTWLPPTELYGMGFRQVVFPGLLITRVAQCINVTLQQFRKHVAGEVPMPPIAEAEQAQEALRKALNFEKWLSIGRQP